MNQLARRCISTVQHSLLGYLFVRLWVLLPLVNWVTLYPGAHLPMAYLNDALGVLVVSIFVIWLLGFLAIHELPKGGGALQRIHDAPRNSFEVWYRLPDGGLRPPRLMRAVVETLGRQASGGALWTFRAALALCLVAVTWLLLAGFARSTLTSISPLLVDPAIRSGLLLYVVAFGFAAVVRRWAIECRERLAADADGPGDEGFRAAPY